MASITLKDIPQDLLDQLRSRAQADRRSLVQEVFYLLERALQQCGEPTAPDRNRAREEQLRVWRELAGSWESELSVSEEIRQIYSARTPGRPVDW